MKLGVRANALFCPFLAILRVMKRSLYLLLAIFAFLSSCDDGDEVPSRTIFTFTNMRGSFPTIAPEVWVIIHDNETQELVDARMVPNGTTTFESTKRLSSDKITVTIFEASTSSPGYSGSSTYRDVDVGAEWANARILKASDDVLYSGDFDLRVTDVPSVYSVVISDGYNETIIPGTFTFDNETIAMSPMASETARDQMVVVETNDNHPKYLYIEDVRSNQERTVSYNSFKDFDKYLTVELPSPAIAAYMYVTADYRKPYQVYKAYSFAHFIWKLSIQEKNEINVGLLNSISNYYIDVRGGSWFYVSQGEAPSSIEYVSNEGYTSTGTTYDNFKITTSKDYVYSYSSFGYSASGVALSMYHYAPKGSEKPFYSITPEIEAKYKIDRSKLVSEGLTFMVKGRSYADFVSSRYDPEFNFETSYFESSVFGIRK